MWYLSLAYRTVVAGLAFIAGAFLVLMTIGIGAEAIMRSLGLGLIRGIVDFAEHSMFNIALLAAPWIMTRNGHIAINILTSQLSPRGERVAAVLTNLVGLSLGLCLAWYGARIFLQSFRRGELIFQELIIPEWWLQWQVPLVFALLAIEFASRLAAARPPAGTSPAAEGH